MVKFFFTILSLFLFIIPIWSQKEKPPKFGIVGLDELMTNTYNIDTSAVAVILYEKGKFTSNDEFYKYEYFVRIKVLKEEGEKYAQVNIPYIIYSTDNKLNAKVDANSHTLNDGIILKTKMSGDAVNNVIVSQYNGVIRFKIPGVRVGSVIEYKLNLTSSNNFKLNDGWYFQHEIPCLYSEVTKRYPSYWKLDPVLDGPVEKLITHKSQFGTYKTKLGMGDLELKKEYIEKTFSMSNIPAIQKELYSNKRFGYRLSFVTSGYFSIQLNQSSPIIKYDNRVEGPNDLRLVNGMYVSEESTWDGICYGHYNAEAFGQFINSKEFKGEFSKITFTSDSVEDKIKSIYKYVGENFVLDKGVPLSIDRTPQKLLKNKRGKSSDLNLILVNFLKQANINAFPCIAVGRPFTPPKKEYPDNESIYKAICLVILPNGEYYFLDVSGYPNTPEILPVETLNGETFVIYNEKAYEWVPIKSRSNSLKWNTVRLNLNGKKLDCNIDSEHKGQYAVTHAEKFIKDKNEYVENEFRDLISSNELYDLQIKQIPSIENGVFKYSINITTDKYIKFVGDSLIIEPLLVFGLNENPFQDSVRYNQVDFNYPFDELFQLSIQIPKDYSILNLPSHLNLKNYDNSLKFLYAWEKNGDTLNLIYKLNIKKQIFELDEYKELREIFSLVFNKSKEKLILIKSQN